jgi:hypothetical protein
MVTTNSSTGTKKLRLLLIPLVILASVILLFIKAESSNLIQFQLLANNFIDGELKYQLVTLGIAGLLLLIAFILAPSKFKKFFSLGNIDAPVVPVKLIGLNPKHGEGWKRVGINFTVIISLVTFGFIYFNIIRGNSIQQQHFQYLPWILVFSITNSFVEEMITRFGVVYSLDGLIPDSYIYLTSGVIFGLVHYFGVPGGLPGVLLAGFLGWLLAKSIGETKGIFWAWLIHFLQDIIIFTGLFFDKL